LKYVIGDPERIDAASVRLMGELGKGSAEM
jgi:hypothetical protein